MGRATIGNVTLLVADGLSVAEALITTLFPNGIVEGAV
jgi:hypothetical protein